MRNNAVRFTRRKVHEWCSSGGERFCASFVQNSTRLLKPPLWVRVFVPLSLFFFRLMENYRKPPSTLPLSWRKIANMVGLLGGRVDKAHAVGRRVDKSCAIGYW